MAIRKSTDPLNQSFDMGCPDCSCDVILPIMKVRANVSFSGNRLQFEWPSRSETQEEFARAACPQCGLVFTIKADGTISRSGNRLFSGKPFLDLRNGSDKGRRAKARV